MSLDLRAELTRIYETHGRLTPALVVQEWADPASPFHNRLEWNDVEAADRYRLTQAAQIIRSVKITFVKSSGSNEKVRAFHAVRTEVGNVYKPADEVANDPFLSRLLMQEMEREWRQLKARFERFAEFWFMVNRDEDNPEAEAEAG